MKKQLKQEAGQALLIVLVFLVIGSLMLPPLLAYMSTSLKNNELYESKSDSLYAADAGVEDAMWKIKTSGQLEALAGGDDNFAYDFTSNWTYELESPVNGLTTNVTISNVWLPSNVTMSGLGMTAAQAKDIMEPDMSDNNTDINYLLVTGTPVDEDDYRIKIDFYPAEDETDALEVDSIGVWLPQGFTYDDGCNLATFPDSSGKYTESVESTPGGEAVVWDFSASPLLFTDLPPEDLYPENNPQSAEIIFKYATSDTSVRPAAVPWFVTSGNFSTEFPMVWDVETRYYKITSAAGDTEIETYAARSELRNLYGVDAGNFVAIGNSQMLDTNSDNVRDDLKTYTEYDLDTLHEDSDVIDAYLYWSGFYKSGFSSPDYWLETCGDMDDWDGPNQYWAVDGGRFRGRDNASGNATRYLELSTCIDLSGCSAGQTILEWDQSESGNLDEGDYLMFYISGDDGENWSDGVTVFSDDSPDSYYYYVIPEGYLTDEFMVKFYIGGFDEKYYSWGHWYYDECFLDNISVAQITGTADTSVDFTIDGYDTYTETVNARESQVLGTKERGQYFYSCWQQVDTLVLDHCEQGPDGSKNGNALYAIEDLDADEGDCDPWPTRYHLAYAGWSLIIVYSDPNDAARQFYHWDRFSYNSGNDMNLDFDGDGEPGGLITGFIIPEQIEGDTEAARLTCFIGEGDAAWTPDTIEFNGTRLEDGTGGGEYNVWNGQSQNMNNGIDIDTFIIEWDDGLLFADDTEAQVDMYSNQDNYVLIYIILSVRSEVTMSSTTHYVISG